jgi:hypothetical protein
MIGKENGMERLTRERLRLIYLADSGFPKEEIDRLREILQGELCKNGYINGALGGFLGNPAAWGQMYYNIAVHFADNSSPANTLFCFSSTGHEAEIKSVVGILLNQNIFVITRGVVPEGSQQRIRQEDPTSEVTFYTVEQVNDLYTNI